MDDNKQTNSAPVIMGWQNFIFRSEKEEGCYCIWLIHAGIDKTGKIWLQLSDVRETVFDESDGALKLDKFYGLVNKLPEAQCGIILLSLHGLIGFYDVSGITSVGLSHVIQALAESQPEQVIKAANRVLSWLESDVYPQLREFADKQQPKAEAVPSEDLPDEKLDIAARPPFINEFYTLVRSMREAQRQYFKTRSRDTLIESKRLEAAADKEIQRYFDDEQKVNNG